MLKSMSSAALLSVFPARPVYHGITQRVTWQLKTLTSTQGGGWLTDFLLRIAWVSLIWLSSCLPVSLCWNRNDFVWSKELPVRQSALIQKLPARGAISPRLILQPTSDVFPRVLAEILSPVLPGPATLNSPVCHVSCCAAGLHFDNVFSYG